jgi:hypothetical protein
MAVTLENWSVDAKLDRLSKNQSLWTFAANQMMVGMDAYVPFEHGDLSGDAIAEPFGVVYTQDYAAAQYYGVGFNHTVDQHPLAMAKWDAGFKAAKMGAFETAVENYVKGNL